MDVEIKIGDKVRFLDFLGGGTVTGFQKGGLVLVEDEDGFEVPVLQSEVVVVNEPQKSSTPYIQKPKETSAPKEQTKLQPTIVKPVKEDSDNNNADEEAETLEARVLRLEMTIRKLQRRIERLEDAKALREKIKGETLQKREQERAFKDDILEIDLHIDELLDTTAGMSSADIKEYQLSVFNKIMNENKNQKNKKIVFIHGNGEGVLRKAIINELRKSYPSCQYQDASFQQYGFGATMVIIR